MAASAVPEMNGYWENDSFMPAANVSLGVAISLRSGGLIAPVIPEAQKLPLEATMKALSGLVLRSRSNTLRASDMVSPSITVTNLGYRGVEKVYGVIYPPQVALVGFGKIFEQPIVERGEIRSASVVVATLAADHRVSDGQIGSKFLNEVRKSLEKLLAE